MAQAKSPKARKQGAQLSISPSRANRLLAAIAGGNYITVACSYAGVTKNTYANWRRIGERELEVARTRFPAVDVEELVSAWIDEQTEGRHLQYGPEPHALWKAKPPVQFKDDAGYWMCVVFAHLLEKATAEAEVRAVTQIQTAARSANHWQAAMTFLERRHPDRWRRKDQVQMEGVPGGAPIQVQEVPTTEQVMERIAKLAREAAAQDTDSAERDATR